MSEPQSPEFEPRPESAPESASEPTGLTKPPLPEPESAGAARRRSLRLPRGRGARWAAGAAAAVVLGVVAVGAGAAWERHSDHGAPGFDRVRAGKVPPGLPGLPGGAELPGGPGKLVIRGEDGSVRSVVVGKAPGGVFRSEEDVKADDIKAGGGKAEGKLAPAALPTVPADQALAKAVAAVPNGRAAGLAVVGREGGGSSWSVEVLAPDGVRHLVTVDGTDGSVTGNTVAGGR
ncbi:PepSY domain-containing protein [Kitasatospora sp. NPDC001540]|uniref:PepSY domain-containing protein n=1 Tax=Kitasatospora sp. NPDC001540 TaxID=3364014 RepID=UPI00369E21A5